MNMFSRITPLCMLVLCAPGLFTASALGQNIDLTEASGITRSENTLYLVGDNRADAGHYFTYNIAGLAGTLLTLSDQNRLGRVALTKAPNALDLESIELLVDGTVVALSERLRSLVSNDGVLLEYPEPFSELGNRGLEGLAIRPHPLNAQASQIATLWEGGYPLKEDLNRQAQPELTQEALDPVLLLHSRASDGTTVPSGMIRLHLTVPNGWIDASNPSGPEPSAYRFRAPDLVWHKEGFILLLSSERLPHGNVPPPKERFGPKLLQRFDLTGRPIGKPYDLATPLQTAGTTVNKNWEGLGWFEMEAKLMGTSLALS